ncbi:YdbH domain-containing protein [Nitrosomonas sp. Nm33]|uniref:intermembrane phospholipid transport protein YdbH family protein n=1 Tax=Nitrosomonas sp. Nm33 TaxID=133724 RepID=UPI0008970E55|nr:YdbH domain-containing protein [Nitrosomonas sp. Nm33]SDZ02584.1 Dicarboxylate transport [Nitrosomonas sp. Nm33]
MSKRLATWLMAFAGFIIITVSSFYAFRLSLLESLISEQLRKQGILVHSLSVTDISFNTLLLRNLSMGNDKELQIDKIHVTWHLRDLLAGTVGSIEISGLQAALNLDSKRSPMSVLQPMISSSGENTGQFRFPAISLLDSTIHLHSAWGNFAITLTGNLDRGGWESQAAYLRAEISGAPGQIKSTLTATLGANGNLQGKITVSEGKLNLPKMEVFNLSGEAAFILTAMRPQHIKAEFVLSDIHLPGRKLAKQIFKQARLSLQMDETNAQLTGKLLTSDDTHVAHLDVTMRHYLVAPDIDLALNTSSTANLDSDWLASFGLPPGTVIDRIKLTGAFHGSPDAWTGKLDLHADADRLVAGPLVVHRASATLPLQLHFDHGTWRMGLQESGQLTLDRIDPLNAVSLKGPLNLSIQKMDIELVNHMQGLAFNHYLVATATNFTLLVKQEETQAIEAQIHPGKMILSGKYDAGKKYQGKGIINGMDLTLPQSNLHLDNIAATLHLGTPEKGNIADFTIGKLHHQVSAPYFAPLSISGSIKSKSVHGQSKIYSMNAVGGVPGTWYLRIMGEQVLDSGDGMLKIVIAPLDFAVDGLQPKTLFPNLSQLKNVSGMVSASAKFRWSKKGISSSGMLELDNVSFIHQAGKISGLNATLNLTDLLSPSSPPQQTLTIRRIDLGIPIESLVISYQIEDSPPRIVLEKANLFLLGGIVSLGPTLIDPTSARNDVVIFVNNIDLEAFFDQVKVEGLTGNGRLDGSVPIMLEGDHIIIRNSHLEAKVPGMLQFQSEKASQLLAGSGKEMKLLLQALQDFHYTELSLKLDKSAAHDLVTTLSLLGNNPNVKEGRMFRLNINLESNIGKILEAIGQGYRLSNKVLRDLFRLH